MRERPAARLILVDPSNRVLLFLFHHKSGPIAGKSFWATPGGAVDAGETFEAAARRELFEETGLRLPLQGVVATSRPVFHMPDGEQVIGDEKLFLVRCEGQEIETAHWTELERNVMADWRWWSVAELRSTHETFFPENLADIVESVGQ